MKIRILTALIACVFTIFFLAASAMCNEDRDYISVKAGCYLPEKDFDDDNDLRFSGEISFGHYYSPYFAIQGDIGWLEVDAVPALLTGRFIYPKDEWELFADVGIGAYFVDSSYTGNDPAFGFRLGLGFLYDITPKIFVGFEAKYFWADTTHPDIDGIVAMVPIGFRF